VERDGAGAAKVPLQFTIETRMRKILEAECDAGGQRSQFGHNLRRQIFALRQRLAVEIGEQPYLIVFVVDGQHQDVLAALGQHGLGDAGHVCKRCQVPHGGVLRGQFDRRVFGAADLQDVGRLAGVDAEVPVLLAAEFLERALQTVIIPENASRLLCRHVGSGQFSALEQCGVGHGRSPSRIILPTLSKV
jgi:hypothetical protein